MVNNVIKILPQKEGKIQEFLIKKPPVLPYLIQAIGPIQNNSNNSHQRISQLPSPIPLDILSVNLFHQETKKILTEKNKKQ